MTRSVEADVDLSTGARIADVFDDPDDEAVATFEFEWGYMDFDDYNGWSVWDPHAPRMSRPAAKMVTVGSEVHLPHTSSVFAPAIKVATYVGGNGHGTVAIWTEGQDPAVDGPTILAFEDTEVLVRTSGHPAPDLNDPEQFGRELARRVYEETARQASSADESHDVERLAHQIAEDLTPVIVAEALAQRTR